MSLYAIGDVHGCYSQMRRLLDQISFDPTIDELWLAGDLVNRGKDSLQTLRFIKQLGEKAHTVLGNHDFHLMRFVAGFSKSNDAGIQAILNAPDCDELLDWLYHRPLVKIDHKRRLILVHAGVFPQWDLATLETLADEVAEQIVNASKRHYFLQNLYGDSPLYWNENLSAMERLRTTVNVMTRMRYLGISDMRLDFSETGAPQNAPSDLQPWYTFDNPHTQEYTLLFGHWAAQGFMRINRYIALDSGCVWGNQLTAVRLDGGDEEVFQVQCG